MKEQMRHIYKVMLVIIALILQACGSSGDKTIFSISADVDQASFSHEVLQESTDSITIQVNYEGDGLLVGFVSGTEPMFIPEQGSDPISWLSHRLENVTETSATVILDVQNSQPLAPNTYATTLRISTSNDDASKFASHDIDISLLVWNLAVDTQKVKYNGTFGDSSIVAQSIAITSETNEWTASTDVDWLSLDVTSGTGDGVIQVTPDISSFSASGLQQANIILTEVTSGDSKSIPVDLALDNVYLLAEHPTVSFTSTPEVSALETTMAIGNNSELALSWQASTEANWLTVTAIDENQLQIIADPSLAPLNENSLAEVIVSASEGTTIVSDTIKVNLYNSDMAVENKVLTPLAINNNEMVVAPLAPLFYVGVENQLITYHQYTGEVESTLVVSPENTVLEQLIMHPSGDYLLAKAIETVIVVDPAPGDETTNEVVHRYKVNLIDNTVSEILEADISFEPAKIMRILGRYFVVTQTLEFADENLKMLFWDGQNAYFTSEIDIVAQTSTLFASDNNADDSGVRMASFKRYVPQVNDFGDDKITAALTHEYHPDSLVEGAFIRDFIVANDEKNIYAISETSEWVSFDGEAFIDNGLLEADENVVTLFLEKNNDSQPNYLRIDPTISSDFYLDIYNNQQTISSKVLTQTSLPSQPSSIKLSGDNKRLIINVDSSSNPDLDSQVELVTLTQ